MLAGTHHNLVWHCVHCMACVVRRKCAYMAGRQTLGYTWVACDLWSVCHRGVRAAIGKQDHDLVVRSGACMC